MSHSKKRRSKKKRKIILLVVEIIVLALVVTVLYFWSKIDNVDTEELDYSKIEVNDLPEQTILTLQGYTTIVFFGLDNRSSGELEAGRSDMIMIVSINNDTKDVAIVSVYRDTLLDISPANGTPNYQKCNAAYAYGGAEQAITMLNRALDINIDEYVTVDFDAVSAAIDAIGGVEITIESTEEMEQVNKNLDLARSDGMTIDSPYLTSTGTQTLDGNQAVAYGRIRKLSGGDMKRAQRQRTVLLAMIKKIKSAGVTQYLTLLDEVFPLIKTSYSSTELISVGTTLLGYDISNSRGFPFRMQSNTYDVIGSVDVPCTLETNVERLHELLYDVSDYEVSSSVLEQSNYIINYTGYTEESGDEEDYTEVESDDSSGSGTDSSGSESGASENDDPIAVEVN